MHYHCYSHTLYLMEALAVDKLFWSGCDAAGSSQSIEVDWQLLDGVS